MRTASRIVTAIVIAAAVAMMARAEDKKPDKDLIQGTWRVVKVVVGENLERPIAKDEPDCVFDGDNYFSVRGDKKLETGTFKLDATKNPKQIDLDLKTSATTQPGALKGIYELEGNKLRFTFGADGLRPTGFDTEHSTGVVVSFERKK